MECGYHLTVNAKEVFEEMNLQWDLEQARKLFETSQTPDY